MWSGLSLWVTVGALVDADAQMDMSRIEVQKVGWESR